MTDERKIADLSPVDLVKIIHFEIRGEASLLEEETERVFIEHTITSFAQKILLVQDVAERMELLSRVAGMKTGKEPSDG